MQLFFEEEAAAMAERQRQIELAHNRDMVAAYRCVCEVLMCAQRVSVQCLCAVSISCRSTRVISLKWRVVSLGLTLLIATVEWACPLTSLFAQL